MSQLLRKGGIISQFITGLCSTVGSKQKLFISGLVSKLDVRNVRGMEAGMSVYGRREIE